LFVKVTFVGAQSSYTIAGERFDQTVRDKIVTREESKQFDSAFIVTEISEEEQMKHMGTIIDDAEGDPGDDDKDREPDPQTDVNPEEETNGENEEESEPVTVDAEAEVPEHIKIKRVKTKK